MHPVLREEVEGFDADTLALVRSWAHYERGHLLIAGGIDDQPARWLEAMELLTAEVGRRDRIAWERRRRVSAAGYGDSGRKPMKIHGIGPGARSKRLA